MTIEELRLLKSYVTDTKNIVSIWKDLADDEEDQLHGDELINDAEKLKELLENVRVDGKSLTCKH